MVGLIGFSNNKTNGCNCSVVILMRWLYGWVPQYHSALTCLWSQLTMKSNTLRPIFSNTRHMCPWWLNQSSKTTQRLKILTTVNFLHLVATQTKVKISKILELSGFCWMPIYEMSFKSCLIWQIFKIRILVNFLQVKLLIHTEPFSWNQGFQ